MSFMHQIGWRLAVVAISGIIGFNQLASAATGRDATWLKVIRQGDSVEIDPSGFAPAQKEGYAVLKKHCTECHGQDRIIDALQTGKSHSGHPYGEEDFHHKVTSILRRPGVGMSRDDARKLEELLTFLVKGSRRH